MNYSDLVCSIQFAISLNEISLQQNSLFYYELLSGKLIRKGEGEILCSAYLTDELLEYIPPIPEKDGYTFNWLIERLPDSYIFILKGNQVDSDENVISLNEKKLADLLARAVIYLVKNEFLDFT